MLISFIAVTFVLLVIGTAVELTGRGDYIFEHTKGLVVQWVENATPFRLDALNSFTVHSIQIILAIAYLLLIVTFYKFSLARWLEFHLLSPMDSSVLTPPPQYTGILKWAGPQQQQQQQEAWDQIHKWLNTGAQGSWLGFKPDLETPFSWMVLAGPNGLGKTQMALEIGISISTGRKSALLSAGGNSSRWQVLGRELTAWLKRDAHQPWDVGTIDGQTAETAKRLEQWAPRRPTFIILV